MRFNFFCNPSTLHRKHARAGVPWLEYAPDRGFRGKAGYLMVRLAIIGLDTRQRPWLEALAALRAASEVQLVAAGHASAATARELADFFKAAGPVPAYDDPRRLMQETTPQVILLDRPKNVGLDFLTACAAQNVGIFSLGPAVESLAEAQVLAQVLEPRTHLLHIWPHFADAPAARRSAQADEFLRPIRFASATWLGVNYALAKAATALDEVPVRSLSVLAWDLLGTLIPLMGVPTTVYATIRGTVGGGQSFADISGAAAVTLRFPEDAAASLTLCDHVPAHGQTAGRRDLMLWGNGTLRLSAGGGGAYEFRDESGKLIDATPATPTGAEPVVESLREFLRQFTLPDSPHRGRPHLLEEIAATLEAMVVSHRTGQPESPDRLRRLRR